MLRCWSTLFYVLLRSNNIRSPVDFSGSDLRGMVLRLLSSSISLLFIIRLFCDTLKMLSTSRRLYPNKENLTCPMSPSTEYM